MPPIIIPALDISEDPVVWKLFGPRWIDLVARQSLRRRRSQHQNQKAEM
jgi:hypothetical protein